MFSKRLWCKSGGTIIGQIFYEDHHICTRACFLGITVSPLLCPSSSELLYLEPCRLTAPPAWSI